MFPELIKAIESRGAILLFLPPYSPQLNPIEVGFNLVKKFIQKHAGHIFQFFPEEVMDVAFRNCAKKDGLGVNLFNHCGYLDKELDFEKFFP
jgi:hypothetical protein